jgi:serine/threonine-protein kinase
MSSVFYAVHVESGHEVAVKILPRTLAKNPTLLQRFLREAKSAESLEHPNISAIYDRGFDQGRHYLVLEYVEGGDLHERVKANGPLPLAEAIRAVRGVAEGLRYAAQQGVIHRDIKPANLLCAPDGTVKIIDLGLALQTVDEDERVTRDGTTVGTVDYMSPEQARDSRATSERSDMYSLGCTLHYLITGKPPFPGGDVPDKLGRHCTAPPPDVRDLRPDASEPLARLIQKMMAKKPDARFATYDALINAFDNLPEVIGEPSETLDVIVDDEDLVEDDILNLASAAPSPTPPKPAFPKTPLIKPKPPEPVRAEPPQEILLSELAGMDADDPPVRKKRPAAAAPVSVSQAMLEPDFVDDPVPSSGIRTSTSRDLPISTWVAVGAITGLSIALLGFAVISILTPATPDFTASDVTQTSRPENTGENGEGVVNEPARPITTAPPAVVSTVPKTGTTKKATPVVEPAVAWIEPTDPTEVKGPEPVYPTEVETAALPVWARSPIPTTNESPTQIVRRFAEAGEEPTSLRRALDRPQGTVEIADNGPFFEGDLRVAGKSRVIKARPGFRPVIVFRPDPASPAIVRDRPALIVLDRSKLLLEGIDLVVDTQGLPNATTAIFLLRGAELTLSNSTVTVLNSRGRAFVLARVDEQTDETGTHGARLRVERSVLRCATNVAFDVNGAVDIVFNRSFFAGGNEAIFGQRPSTVRGERAYSFVRSIFATRGSVIDFAARRPTPVPIKAVGSTFAKLVGVSNSGFLRLNNEPQVPAPTVLAWTGFGNAFVGWPSWISAGERNVSWIPSVASAKQVWAQPDTGSEAKKAWPSEVLADDCRLSTIEDLADSRSAILDRLPWPSPILLQATVQPYKPIHVPKIPPRLPRTVTKPAPRPPVVATKAATKKGAPPVAKVAEGKDGELVFDVTSPTYRGDLGLFLARRITTPQKVHVKVTGSGDYSFTPVRLPDGSAVEIEAEAENGFEPNWTAISSQSGAALIELSKGELVLKGIHLNWSPAARVPFLIRVEDSHLRLHRCLISSGRFPMAGGSLIAFRAASTKKLDPVNGAFLGITDRPTLFMDDSVISVEGGEAIGAEVGRGIVHITNSVIVSQGEGAAFGLRPQAVAKSRFEADLLMDHSTIAAEKTIFAIGPWLGKSPGPERPWVITGSNNAYIGLVSKAGKHDATMVRSKGEAIGHNVVAFQSHSDGFDVTRFIETSDQLAALKPGKLDIENVWVDYWGTPHMVNWLGPNATNQGTPFKYVGRDRPSVGFSGFDALKLDPKAHPDLGADPKFIATKKSLPLGNAAGGKL